MGQTFEVNLESISLYLNGASESVDYEVEEVEGSEGQIFIGKTSDGVIAALEVYGPMRVTTDKTPMRVATRFKQQEAMNEELGMDRDQDTMNDAAHRTAAESGTAYTQTNRGRGLRGDGGVAPGADNEMKSGMVVNPNTSADSGRDVMDANARDDANGSFGRHGVSTDTAAISPRAEDNHANAKEVSDPNRTGQNSSSRMESAAGDDKKAVETRKKSEENAQKKVDERHDALAKAGDIQGNNSEAARMAVTNSEEEENARKDEKKANDKDQVATLNQDDANSESSSSKKSKNARTPEEKV